MDNYSAYISEHIANVQHIWSYVKDYIDKKDINDIQELISQHDLSKYSVHEYEGYRQYFYPGKHEVKDEELFNRAWNHHQKHNPHHWEYWVMYKKGKNTPLDMPFKYIIEMLCDWSAMSLKFDNKVSDWYEKEKDNMCLSNITIKNIEKYIPVCDNILANTRKAH